MNGYVLDQTVKDIMAGLRCCTGSRGDDNCCACPYYSYLDRKECMDALHRDTATVLGELLEIVKSEEDI